MKTAFIINPKSAKGKYQKFLPTIKKLFPNTIIHISKSKTDTQTFIKNNWENTDYFIAVGGDGTVSSVANNIINTTKILGIIPTGSGNGFAIETKFNQNIKKLHQKITNGNITTIDAFSVNNHVGINVAGIGFDAHVVKKFENTNRGLANYIKESIKGYLNFKEIQIKGIENNKTIFSGKYLLAAIANSRQFGNNAFIAPNASLQDGLVEIVLVKKIPWWESPKFVYQLFTKNIHKNKYVETISAENIELVSTCNHWHIDGDYINIKSPVSIKIIKNSINIIS